MFDPGCRRCPRLAEFLDTVKADYPTYFAAPVAPFGDPSARLLIVGLAPGMHGANRSGRPFTGDFAGILLYRTLYEFGFASAPLSEAVDDGLQLKNCRITNAVKCLPPQNKPEPAEIRTCNDFLRHELAEFPEGGVIVALGTIAHQAVMRGFGLKAGDFKFAHDAKHALPGQRWLVDSYHCSRYNTQTKRLTDDMFRTVFHSAHALLDGDA